MIQQTVKFILVGFVRLYQWGIAPLLGTQCRYEPSCSRYMIEALERHGVWRGYRLGMARILRCHPWGGNGFDPVPPVESMPSSSGDSSEPPHSAP